MDLSDFNFKIFIPLLVLVGASIYVPYFGVKANFMFVSISVLLLLIITVISMFIRSIPDNGIKMLSYVLAGFACYWLAGSAYALDVLAYPRWHFTAYYAPIIALSIANAAAALVAMHDGARNGQLFAGMGFSVIIFNVTANNYMMLRPDVIVTLAILWAFLAIIWARSFSELAHPDYKVVDKVKKSIKIAIVTLPVYLLLPPFTCSLPKVEREPWAQPSIQS